MEYKYGYRLRPPSIGTQPKGFIKIWESKNDGERYWGYATYDRKLTTAEMYRYDLDYIEEEKWTGLQANKDIKGC